MRNTAPLLLGFFFLCVKTSVITHKDVSLELFVSLVEDLLHSSCPLDAIH